MKLAKQDIQILSFKCTITCNDAWNCIYPRNRTASEVQLKHLVQVEKGHFCKAQTCTSKLLFWNECPQVSWLDTRTLKVFRNFSFTLLNTLFSLMRLSFQCIQSTYYSSHYKCHESIIIIVDLCSAVLSVNFEQRSSSFKSNPCKQQLSL